MRVLKYSFFLIIAIINFKLIAQDPYPYEYITLKTLPTESSYVARDWIKLDPGFYTVAGSAFSAQIDEDLVFDIHYLSNQPSPDRQLDTSITVGSLPGYLDVGTSGSATYTIPLSLPPGTAGIQPGFSISYNSNGSNGILGACMGINGFSVISRSQEDYFNDGQVLPVNYDGNDRIYLDGQRLILKNGSWWAVNSEYRTQDESYSIIKFTGSFFTVETPAGVTMYYGEDAGSRLTTIAGDILCWHLTRVVDPFGNTILYAYDKITETNEILPDYVEYTKTSSFSAYNKIEFCYEDSRTDDIITFAAGIKIEKKHILRKISVYCNGTREKEYLFTYFNGNNSISYLSAITLRGKNGNCLHTTQINWSGRTKLGFSGDYEAYYEDNEDLSNFTHNQLNTKLSKLTEQLRVYNQADIDGDNKADLVVTPTEDNTNQTIYTHFRGLLSTISHPMPGGYKNILAVDFDGDQKTELLFHKGKLRNGTVYLDKTSLPSGDSLYDNSFLIWQFNDATQNYQPIATTNNYGIGSLQSGTYQFFPGDFDGSGTCDLLFLSSSYFYLYLSKRTSSGFEFEKKAEGANTLGNCNYFICDYNGDRKHELISVNSSGMSVSAFTYNSSTQFYQINTYLVSSIIVKDGIKPVSLGDVNGDGKTDVFFSRKVFYSRGRFGGSMTAKTFGSSTDNSFIGVDHNADGRSEICTSTFLGDGSNEIKYLYTDNSMLSENDFINDDPYYIVYQFMFADFNGDGFSEKLYNYIMVTEGGAYEYPHVVHRYGAIPVTADPGGRIEMLASRITNGFNNRTDIKYALLNNSDHYIKTENTTAGIPVATVTPGFNAVKQIISDNGVGSRDTVFYSYENARYHYQKGWLGFTKVQANNHTTRLKAIQKFTWDNVFYNFYPVLQATYITAGDTLSGYVPVYKTYNFAISGQKYFRTYLLSAVSKDYKKKQKIVENYTYIPANFIHGNWGTSLIKYITYGSGLETEDARITTSNIFETFSNARFYRLRSTLTNRKRSEDANEHKSKVVYNYTNTTSPVIKNELVYWYTNGIEDGDIDTVTYTYNSFGNRVGISRQFGNIKRDETHTYDDKGRYIASYTNPMNHISTMTWYENGLLQSSRDPNKLEIYQVYDEFERFSSGVTAEGIVSTESFKWIQAGDVLAPPYALFYTLSSQTNRPSLRTYYDALGRALRVTTTALNGKTVIKDVRYNLKGQVEKESDPYFYYESSFWMHYTYYEDGRLMSQYLDNDVKKVNFDYNNNVVTQTQVNTDRSWSRTFDATGTMVCANGPGGLINYSYFSSGNPRSVAALTTTTTMEYDKYGYQKKLTDASADTSEYTYNAYGELIYQKDANGNSFAITSMDKLGRPLIRTYSDGSRITYTYDTDFKGTLYKAVGSNRTATRYLHDRYGRLAAQKDSIEGIVYNTLFEYTPNGDISKITYPSGFGVNYYYLNGYLTQISRTDNSNQLWASGDVNARGQWLNFTVGSSINRVFTYDAQGNVTSIQTGGLQNMQYLFNAETGNLTWRKDVLKSLQENFTYDNADRLLTWKIGSRPADSVIYKIDGTGRINRKSDAGNYAFGNTPAIHAVTSVSSNPGTISGADCGISYTPFNKTDSIYEDNGFRLKYTYGPDQERRVSRLYNSSNALVKRSVYIPGGYQIDSTAGITRKLHYIPIGDCWALFVDHSTAPDTLYYLLTDHQGSVNVITNMVGTKLKEYSYNPWGRRRNPTDWSFNNVPAASITDRGYTMHEHLDVFKLINMNGRVYDPVLGQFLSPDPYVQDPSVPQCFNRYGYCLGNPLKYADPSGYLVNPGFNNSTWDIIENLWYSTSNSDYGWSYTNRGGGIWSGQQISEGEWVYQGRGIYYNESKTSIVVYANGNIDVWRIFGVPTGEVRIFQFSVENVAQSDGGNFVGDYDNSNYTIHFSTEVYLMGVPNMKFVIASTVGKGPVHMKSINGSEPSLINIIKSGPLTYEHSYTQGGSQKLNLSLGNNYMSLKINAQNFSIGFGNNYSNISMGYEMEAPKLLLQLLVLPILGKAPVPITVPVRITW